MTHKSYSLHNGYGIFLVPGVLGFLAIVVIPFLVNIYISFTKWTGVGTPIWTGLANIQRATRDTSFWASFNHNVSILLLLSTVPTVIGLVLGVILYDYIGTKFGPRVASFFRAGFYLPQILPAAVAGLVWGWILQPDHGALNALFKLVGAGSLAHDWLGDSQTALLTVIGVMIWFQIGFPLVILMSALQRVDPELGEAASLDGARWFQKLIYITVPLIRPEIYVVILTTMIYALKIFGPIFVLTRGGPGTATMVVSYFSYINFFQMANVGYGATMSTILTIVIMIITVIYLRVQNQREVQEAN